MYNTDWVAWVRFRLGMEQALIKPEASKAKSKEVNGRVPRVRRVEI